MIMLYLSPTINHYSDLFILYRVQETYADVQNTLCDLPKATSLYSMLSRLYINQLNVETSLNTPT
jgi:hypothetical protein